MAGRNKASFPICAPRRVPSTLRDLPLALAQITRGAARQRLENSLFSSLLPG